MVLLFELVGSCGAQEVTRFQTIEKLIGSSSAQSAEMIFKHCHIRVIESNFYNSLKKRA